MTREEQIVEAGKTAAEGKEFSVLVNKQNRTMSAYEIGFIEGAEWADSHPAWVSVEEELPKEKGAYLFHFDDGQTRVEGYFPELHLSKCVTHWKQIVPPVKKEGEQ